MKNEQRYNLHRLAEELVTPERYSKAVSLTGQTAVTEGDEALTRLATECHQEEQERLARHETPFYSVEPPDFAA